MHTRQNIARVTKWLFLCVLFIRVLSPNSSPRQLFFFHTTQAVKWPHSHTTLLKSQGKKRCLCDTQPITETTHGCCRSCGWHSSAPASQCCWASGPLASSFPPSALPWTREPQAGTAKVPFQRRNLLFSSHHHCSMGLSARMLLVITQSPGVSLCYTTLSVHRLFNFSFECQTFCSLALDFLQLPAALIALCCQTEDCFLSCVVPSHDWFLLL